MQHSKKSGQEMSNKNSMCDKVCYDNKIMRGLTAHILHAGGPWKLESHFRSYSDTTQANTAPGGRFRMP